MSRDTNPDDRTGSTLWSLLRAPDDQEAWRAFVNRYRPRLEEWCRRWRVPPADADVVVQDVLVLLAGKIRTFAYDPRKGSFRGWLRTLTHHAWADYRDGQYRGRGAGGSDALRQLQAVAARDDLEQRLAEAFDLELWEEAQARVRLRVAPTTWEAFRLLALEGVSGAEAAAQLGVKVAAVFVSRSRVQKLLEQEVRDLQGEESGGPP
jgi:RNA polymerase sigma-70 factor (ECF subfamily)